MKNIRELEKSELEKYILSINEPKYRVGQIFYWLHKQMVDDLSNMTNVSKKIISQIENDFDTSFPIMKNEFISKDGTKKYLIKLNDDSLIETVLMKYKFGYSICISTQVGCNMGCIFCASKQTGLKRNLTTSEMLSQIYIVSKHNNIKINNIVIMGVGEPLNNFSNLIKFLNIINDSDGQNISFRNITISTCGIIENIYKIADLNMPLNIALSLHASNDETRRYLMPISKKYKIDELLDAMYYYFLIKNRRITFEYILIENVNDSKENAIELASKLNDKYKNKKIDYLINLIPFNKVKNTNLKSPTEGRIYKFRDTLKKYNINVTIRRELGSDISGSCGQLRSKYINKNNDKKNIDLFLF